ncbi:uncharacterized protein LOC117172562 [Belonocnema kinseyi]|uniref:uncharacterized protein LOC117172562 n=1 Tax=Belonocnema kinseyi TaxID=2817044 RepID=UPI00143CC1FA|nr:uncharacterized protein LOC117172562 [Belonocnema kinseyi]
MKFADGLFLRLSLFLHSIELISSQRDRARPTNLALLFRHSHGVHFPKTDELNKETVHGFSKFGRISENPINEPEDITYLTRGKVIFGYVVLVDSRIKPLGNLFNEPDLCAVFHKRQQRWYTLTSDELEKLGVTRSLPLVMAHDAAHDEAHGHYPPNRSAHHEASRSAYAITRAYEETLGHLGQQDAMGSVMRCYLSRYNLEYASHVTGPSRQRCTYL